MKKPFIARDTGEPLVILGGYRVAEDGGLLPAMVRPDSEPVLARKARMQPDVQPCPVAVARVAMESALGELRKATARYRSTGSHAD